MELFVVRTEAGLHELIDLNVEQISSLVKFVSSH